MARKASNSTQDELESENGSQATPVAPATAPNKSEAIRLILKERPAASVQEVMDIAKERYGLQIQKGHVYVVKGKLHVVHKKAKRVHVITQNYTIAETLDIAVIADVLGSLRELAKKVGGMNQLKTLMGAAFPGGES